MAECEKKGAVLTPFVTTQVVRFKVHSWLPYLHTGLYSSFSNLEP